MTQKKKKRATENWRICAKIRIFSSLFPNEDTFFQKWAALFLEVYKLDFVFLKSDPEKTCQKKASQTLLFQLRQALTLKLFQRLQKNASQNKFEGFLITNKIITSSSKLNFKNSNLALTAVKSNLGNTRFSSEQI